MNNDSVNGSPGPGASAGDGGSPGWGASAGDGGSPGWGASAGDGGSSGWGACAGDGGSPAEIVVVGGGLAGLTAAILAARAGHTVTLHEGRRRLGGRATTDTRDGFRFNQGPHALYRGGPAETVLAELGIAPKGVTPPLAGAMADAGGRLERLIVGPGSLITSRLLGSGDKLALVRVLTRLGRLDPASVAGLTVAQWLDGVTDREGTRRVLEALVRLSSYTNAPGRLSAEVAVTQLRASLHHGVVYLDGGWGRLVRRLAEMATAVGVRMVRGDRLGELPDAPAVIVAVGSPRAAAALTGHPYPDGIAADVSVLDLGLAGRPSHDFVLGVDVPGVDTRDDTRPTYLSNHGVAGDMAPPGHTPVSVARYLGPDDEPASRDQLAAWARSVGVDPGQVVAERYLRRMPAVTRVATADEGGLAGRPPVRVPGRAGVFVAGDWVGPVGHLADAVFASARDAARAAVDHVRTRAVIR